MCDVELGGGAIDARGICVGAGVIGAPDAGGGDVTDGGLGGVDGVGATG
ncbi:MAG TPA: hypothetical protein VLM79_00365 [Kofleriaceae bacterium]|nr:hypothetical protein [Kofleriaceae bacterium]